MSNKLETAQAYASSAAGYLAVAIARRKFSRQVLLNEAAHLEWAAAAMREAAQ